MNTHDTIAAISSAPGPAVRMIVRVSGPQAWGLARALMNDLRSEPRVFVRGFLRLRDMNVPASLCRFKGPESYTGDDLVEFHLPGNVLLARTLMEELFARGARAATAGEFTARAYFNARMNLAEAEGVAAMVSAQNDGELRAARQLMGGEMARRLRPVLDAVAETLALIEVAIDFSDEDVTFLPADEVLRRVDSADSALDRLLTESARFERLSHEPTVVLVGRPNAGKSTLLNALVGKRRAVVSDVAGTTRDVLSGEVKLARGIIKVLDVAGIEDTFVGRRPAGGAQEVIDREMRNRSLAAVETADVVVSVEDAADLRPRLRLPRDADLIVRTKADLPHPPGEGILVGAVTDTGMDALRDALDHLCFGTIGSSAIALNSRHLAAIDVARAGLAAARQHVTAKRSELVALGLREALDALGEILGNVSPDDVLGRVFSRFCIGK